MSAGSPGRIVVEIGASRALAAILAGLHAGAGAIAVTLPLAWPWRLVLLLFVLASGYRVLRLHALRRAPASVVAFALGDEDRCALRRRAGADWEEGRVLDCRVHPRLALIGVRLAGHRLPVSIVIPADAVAAEPFRRLRVRLRLGAAAD